MSKAKIQQRIKVKPFVKYINLNHVMPTRIAVASELELDGVIKTIEKATADAEDNSDMLTNPDFRSTLVKKLKGNFEGKYSGLNLNDTADSSNSKLRFFFKRLRF